MQDAWMQIKLCFSMKHTPSPRVYIYIIVSTVSLPAASVVLVFIERFFISPGTTGGDNNATPPILTRAACR